MTNEALPQTAKRIQRCGFRDAERVELFLKLPGGCTQTVLSEPRYDNQKCYYYHPKPGDAGTEWYRPDVSHIPTLQSEAVVAVSIRKQFDTPLSSTRSIEPMPLDFKRQIEQFVEDEQIAPNTAQPHRALINQQSTINNQQSTD